MRKPIIINNHQTNYEADEDGKIYNIITQKELTGTIYNTGYKMVRLTTEEGKKGYGVHRLIAQTFIPNPNNLPIVNHIDGNKQNNCVSNLEWVTQSQNRNHAINKLQTGLAKGERNKKEIIEDNIFWKRYLDTNYLVSKDGQVYNTKTKILLKQTPNQSGYIRYTLRINNQNKSKQAHVLVIETWTKENLEGKVVNHIDGNKINNNLENLEVISKSENAMHAIYQLQKIGKPIIEYLDSDIKEYLSINEAARNKGVSDGAIRYALKNHSKCCGSYWRYK